MHYHNPNRHAHSLSNHSGTPKNIVSYEVALKNKQQIAEGTYAFVFEKPAGFHFKAGQHVRITLIDPPETDSEGNSRFFSLASTPQETNLVIAMRMRDTAFKRVLGRMPIGNKVLLQIRLDNPHGSFALHEDAAKPAVFLIGGIGIVPAFSMIKDAIERKLPHTVFIFYSNRRPDDAPFLNELENLAKRNPSFKLIATMTEPEKSAKLWRGEIGFINQNLLKKYVGDLEAPIYYIAGLSEMVSAMKTLLADVGVNENNLRTEEFAGFKMDHMQTVTHRTGKSGIPLIAIVLAIGVMVILLLQNARLSL